MKYKVNFSSLLIGNFVMILIASIILFFSTFNFNTFELNPIFYLVVITLIFCVSINLFIDRLFRYYSLEKKYFVNKKILKKEIIEYSDIIYIDEEQFKKGMLFIYLNNGLRFTYMLDKEKELGYALIKKCRNLISKDDFETQFPHLKSK